MYNCEVCGNTSSPRQGRLIFVIKYGPDMDPRLRGQVKQEVPVCEKCKHSLEAGVPYPVLLRQRRRVENLPTITVEEVLEAPPTPPPSKPVEGIGRPVKLDRFEPAVKSKKPNGNKSV